MVAFFLIFILQTKIPWNQATKPKYHEIFTKPSLKEENNLIWLQLINECFESQEAIKALS